MMTYWILPESGIPISCSTLQRLTYLEKQTDEWKRSMESYERGLEQKFNASTAPLHRVEEKASLRHIIDLESEDQEFLEEFNRVINKDDVRHADEFKFNEFGDSDPYLSMELFITMQPLIRELKRLS